MFTIALIGRPNVGKSTFFNRIVGKALAIVDDRPGVTRDWRDAEGTIFGRPVRVIDTAGLEEAEKGSLAARMTDRTKQALDMSDIAIFMIDGVAGLTPADQHFAMIARRSGKPILLVVNKSDTKAARGGLSDSYTLGLGEPYFISASHGEGLADLYQAIMELMPAELDEEEEDFLAREEAERALPEDFDELEGNLDYEFEDTQAEIIAKRPIKLAIVGRPNAGKSTLVNAILGEDRVLTGPEAGLTRDPIAVDWIHEDQQYQLVDTAGLRRKSRITDKVEQLSTRETLRIIRLAQVVVLVIDAVQGIDKQDLNIAQHVVSEGRVLIIALNKWDIVEDRAAIQKSIRRMLDTVFGQLPGAPVVYLSGLMGKGLEGLFETVTQTYNAWNNRVGTGKLNRWLAKAESRHPAPMVSGRPNRLRYMTQVKARPPTFALWCSKPKDLPEDYQRYLINSLREDAELGGVPIRLMLRTSKNPYAK